MSRLERRYRRLLLTADAGEYGMSTTSVTLTADPEVDREETLRTAQERLRAAGWKLRVRGTRKAGLDWADVADS